jgi:predicted  nucleic acid-binding Zn-ribbon protein
VTPVVNAAPQDQWRLLDVQAHDTKLAQLAHRRRTLPELAQIADLEARIASLDSRLVLARSKVGDAERAVAKAEADVEVVRSRARRNQQRLDAGQGAPKELQAMQHELESLAHRQSVLEDEELEVMESLESAQQEVTTLEADRATALASLQDAAGRRDAVFGQLDDDQRTTGQARASAAAGLPAELLALYERVAGANGGVGAARLHQRRCEGCRLELTAADIGRIRAAAQDAVIRCEECGRILIRTADSGL